MRTSQSISKICTVICRVLFYSPVKDTSKESWQMFWIVILLTTFSPGNENDKVKKRKGTHTSLMFLKMSFTYYHPIKVYNIVLVAGCYHQRGSDSRTLQLQVQCVDMTVTTCDKKNINTTCTSQNQTNSLFKNKMKSIKQMGKKPLKNWYVFQETPSF